MRVHSRLLLSLLLSFPLLWAPFTTRAETQNQCVRSLLNSSPQRAETWADLYKRSDRSPRQQVWLRIRQGLQRHVSHLEHPLESAGQNPDRIGAVYKRMSNELPVLRDLLQLSAQMDQGRPLAHADFIRIKRAVANQLIAISHRPNSDLQVFSALETLRLLSMIETRVEFPKTREEIQNEETKKREEEKKKEKDEEEKKKKDKKDEQKEAEPEWNEIEDKYRPENKDLSSDEDSGKQKNVDLVLTDVAPYKGLLRQKIYDQFNLQDWSSVPVGREPLQAERQVSKKLILNPLNAKSVDVPVPYGYTPIPGKYQDHSVIEVGPGEFKIQVSSPNPVTLGLARIQAENVLPSPPRTANPQELAHWPPHLLLFAQSLKGLPPLEAAARLEKYVSKDGGFLYYSKGDKIDKGELAQIDQRLQQLLTKMPKPMAMAHVGAFNCDGAAWIGALLLRDVLNIPVRIAGGRTSAGAKTVGQEKLHVVKSSDPAHAWVEVFDGQRWVPFDMTPKNNTPDSQSSPSDTEREDSSEQDKKQSPQDDQQPSKGKDGEKKEDEKDGAEDGEKDDAKKSNDDKGDDQKDDGKADGEDSQDQQGQKGKDESKDKDKDRAEEQGDGDDGAAAKKVEDLINAKSTQRTKDEQDLSLVERVLRRNELILLESLISKGYQTPLQAESGRVFDTLSGNPRWKNIAERSRSRSATLIQDARFLQFSGLPSFQAEIRVDFSNNNAREAKQKLMHVQRLFLELAGYRSLTQPEMEALHAIEGIIRNLDQIKHKNSKEYEAVESLLTDLPGNISKTWIAKQYGEDYDQLGSAANIQLAHDIVSGRIKPLLQMAAVRDFVDMTLDSTLDPQWEDKPTLNRSLVPNSHQDIVITRNPLDFAKMLWSLRPGEHMFAPTFQGRQFAISSLETVRVPDPENPVEKKVSVIYYDVSPSMDGAPIESQDALLMAFVDKALSETDAIGRPTHEIYLVPFNDEILQRVHISSREDALGFLSRRMNMRTQTSGNTNIQKVVENFYDIIAMSHRNKSAQGIEKLFQKANMVLFSDGGSTIDMKRLEEKRASIPPDIEINMNFVSIGDQVNETLKTLAQNDKLASGRPMFRKMDSKMMSSVVGVSAAFDAEAFATNQRITGQMLSEIERLLQKVVVDTRQKGNASQVDRALAQIQITKTDVSQLPGIREAINLTQLEAMMGTLPLDSVFKWRLVESIIESYPQLTGRTWKEMTYPERDALEKLQAWARR